jgi:hypothetical protein
MKKTHYVPYNRVRVYQYLSRHTANSAKLGDALALSRSVVNTHCNVLLDLGAVNVQYVPGITRPVAVWSANPEFKGLLSVKIKLPPVSAADHMLSQCPSVWAYAKRIRNYGENPRKQGQANVR